MNTHLHGIEVRRLYARRFVVGGRVQGVGFRPFVYRIACALDLKGWVRNGSGQVLIHVEGSARSVERFEQALIAEAPPLAKPHLQASEDAIIQRADDFRILFSEDAEQPDVHLPPDLFCCAACVAEFQNPSEHRYHYPFTNCTQCGPRYTIIEALPYDRPTLPWLTLRFARVAGRNMRIRWTDGSTPNRSPARIADPCFRFAATVARFTTAKRR